MKLYKKLPPFGKVKGMQSEIYLFIGRRSWEKASNFQIQRPGTLCLPAYLNPYDFTWPIKDSEILMFDTSWCDDNYIEEIVKCLFFYEAKIVRFFNSCDDFFVFRKGV